MAAVRLSGLIYNGVFLPFDKIYNSVWRHTLFWLVFATVQYQYRVNNIGYIFKGIMWVYCGSTLPINDKQLLLFKCHLLEELWRFGMASYATQHKHMHICRYIHFSIKCCNEKIVVDDKWNYLLGINHIMVHVIYMQALQSIFPVASLYYCRRLKWFIDACRSCKLDIPIEGTKTWPS